MFSTKKKPSEDDTSCASSDSSCSNLHIDEVWIVPCGLRPDKPHISKPEKRLEMTRLAVQEFFPKEVPIKIDPVEVENGPSIPTYYLLE